ncbi:hypothetical protein DRH29_00130 [candidate division Kazan bacterium]|uniref:Uncharacterized protein n=1 Tax=candidate division Kazan bacterium TaxID=2202143 RepID=A0A420ZDS4_UNCK3|nr:MAG: hypothetical protein DRH29_00130 [candidate division Kazan bacterium]
MWKKDRFFLARSGFSCIKSHFYYTGGNFLSLENRGKFNKRSVIYDETAIYSCFSVFHFSFDILCLSLIIIDWEWALLV